MVCDVLEHQSREQPIQKAPTGPAGTNIQGHTLAPSTFPLRELVLLLCSCVSPTLIEDRRRWCGRTPGGTLPHGQAIMVLTPAPTPLNLPTTTTTTTIPPVIIQAPTPAPPTLQSVRPPSTNSPSPHHRSSPRPVALLIPLCFLLHRCHIRSLCIWPHHCCYRLFPAPEETKGLPPCFVPYQPAERFAGMVRSNGRPLPERWFPTMGGINSRCR